MERYFANDFLAEFGALGNAPPPATPAVPEPPVRLPVPAMRTPLDACVAHRWLENAAADGSAQAQLNLAVCYENGNGVPKDVAAALALYEKAAAQGLRDAQRILGIRYLSGAVGPVNEELGIAWLRQAEGQGDEFARSLVDFYSGKFEARAIEAVQLCHQQSLAALDDGIAASAAVAAAVQSRCSDAIDAWVRARFPEAPSFIRHSLRTGTLEAERSDVTALVLAARTARQKGQ